MLRRIATCLVIIIVLIALPLSVVAPLRNAAVRLIAPIGERLIQQNTRISNGVHNILQLSRLRSDKEDLQVQVINLEQKLVNYDQVLKENQSLRNELGVTGISRSYKKVFGRVIVHSPDPFDRTVTIDVGTADGVKEGQPVVNQGALIGKIISVRQNSSVVRLIISSESRVQAWLPETQEKGLLIGDGNNVYLASISQGVLVQKNSVVSTSGLDTTIPQGIVIGQIGATESKQSDVDQKFQVLTDQNTLALDSVFVLLIDNP